jgi:hypothetical protein
MTIKTMRAKYPGHCSRSGARINPGDDIKFDTITRRAWLEEPGDTRVIFYGETGASTFYRNPRGRCIDAPCCGCCTI